MQSTRTGRTSSVASFCFRLPFAFPVTFPCPAALHNSKRNLWSLTRVVWQRSSAAITVSSLQAFDASGITIRLASAYASPQALECGACSAGWRESTTCWDAPAASSTQTPEVRPSNGSCCMNGCFMSASRDSAGYASATSTAASLPRPSPPAPTPVSSAETES